MLCRGDWWGSVGWQAARPKRIMGIMNASFFAVSLAGIGTLIGFLIGGFVLLVLLLQ